METRPLVLTEMVKSGRFPRSRALQITPIVIDDVIAYHDMLSETNGNALQRVWSEASIRPPFETTWLEAHSGSGTENAAYLAAEVTYGHAVATTKAFIMAARSRGVELSLDVTPQQGFGVEALWVNLWGWINGHGQAWAGSWLAQIDADGKRLPGDFLLVVPNTIQVKDVSWVQIWIGIIHHALALMHVKNVEYVTYGSRTQRRYVDRVAKGIVVKELVIAPLRRTVKMIRQYQQDHPGEPLPLHWCRGHFKTFTPHRPLFGSITGTFWWEPHLRGSEHMGVVVHDRGRIVLPQVAQPQRTP